ncbi:MAG: HAD hydrolase-like protein [Rhodospirillales bacterium]
MTTEIDAAWVFRRYQEIRSRLPVATFPVASTGYRSLAAVTDDFDVFVFDSFGVLNVGEAAIGGAAARISALRAAGKRVFVLTNAASHPLAQIRRKYLTLGFNFDDREIISSRAVLYQALRAYDAGMLWAVVAPESAGIAELPCRTQPFDAPGLEEVDGFVLLSSSGWTAERQTVLEQALASNPRPVLVGNPDLVAPREHGFSRQAGYFAHKLADELGIQPAFFGKPFDNAFALLLSALPENIDRRRVLMIGDTLHTDILGAAAASLSTALVTADGVLRGLDVERCIAESGIRPDIIVPRV